MITTPTTPTPIWVPEPHQEAGAERILTKIKQYGLAYIGWEERTGKSITALLTVALSTRHKPLIITKKAALDGWRITLANTDFNLKPTLVNYHSLHKLPTDLNHDFVILDEAHAYIAGMPKPSLMHKEVARLTKGLPILYVSATPHAQGYHQLYHQFSLSYWSPWHAYRNYYDWHKVYGQPYKEYVGTHQVNKYDRLKDEAQIKAQVAHLFDVKTRADLGFEQEPEDHIHYIELHADTQHVYNTLAKDKVYKFPTGHTMVADSPSKLRYALHALEGGTLKISRRISLITQNQEKMDYISEHWPDQKALVIMYHFIAEETKLKQRFPDAQVLQADTFAEGVDLSGYRDLVIFSQSYSTAKHTQRRARQANKDRRTPINVHFLLVKGAVSEKVYTTVSVNKMNYVDSLYDLSGGLKQ